MVRTYKRKTDRGQWNPQSMKEAIEAIISGEMGYKRAAESFRVPQTTLERRVKEAREQDRRPDNTVSMSGSVYSNKTPPVLVKSLGPITTVFTLEEENLLVQYLLKMEERLFGLTSYDLRRLAFQWAEKLCKKHTFSQEKQVAGKDWLLGFKARHPQITLRKPELTSAARAAAFNKPNVTKFFSLLTRVVDTHKFTPDRIYNCDETGVTVIPKHRSKILALKGRKQVGVLSSAERGNTVTIEVCFNAAGSYMPPLFIFPRVRANDQLMNDCPPGAWAAYHPSGWMQSNIFFQWFKKFVDWSRATKERPVLLLLDGHFTHTKNMDVIDFARENGVVLLCFPPHCTHRLQSLDVSFMKPLSVFYDQEVSCWLRSNPGRVVSLFQISKLYGRAFVKAATMSTAINGFSKTGICPINQGVFSDYDYVPSETTDRPLAVTDNEPLIREAKQTHQFPSGFDSSQTAAASYSPQPAEETCLLQPAAKSSMTPPPVAYNTLQACKILQPAAPIENIQPVCTEINVTPTAGKNLTSSKHTTPEDILPIPSCTSSGLHFKKKSQKHGKTAVLTESPYRNDLQAEINLKREKEMKKMGNAKRNLTEGWATTKKIGTNTKEALQKKFSCKKKMKRTGKETKKTSTKRKRANSSSSESSDAECLYCGHLYSQSTEGWIQCWQCKKWAHCSCAGEEDEDDEAVHVCALCKD